eukprot:Gb_01342 [translate_table: standard]
MAMFLLTLPQYLVQSGWEAEVEEQHISFGVRSVALEMVNDGSVDIKGRPVLRPATGGWKASLFIIGVEFSERLTYYGIASNLIIYLTTVLRQGVEASAKNVNNWSGVTTVMPLVGAFLADAYTGRYWMVLISSIIYLLGLILLTLSVSLPALKPPQCDQPNSVCNKATSTQIGVFFLALYLISFGTGGHKPSLQAFGADQFDEDDKEEKRKKTSFFNWWYFGLSSGVLLAVTVVVYIQDNISWGFGFGIPTVAMAVAIVFFLYGTPFYRHKPPSGSPITRIAQVIVAAFRNRNIPLPSEVGLLYEDMGQGESLKSGQRFLLHTNNIQFLDKAAIVQYIDENQRRASSSPWKLCTVTQVEETKLVIRMVPIWLCCLMFGVTVAQGTTFFIKQGNTMDRSMGPHFQIPSASIMAFSAISTLVGVAIYDRCLVPIAKKITGNERGISILQRIGAGMFVSILCMVTAALVETKRLDAAKSHGLLDSPKTKIPLSVFWLVPQFVLIGVADVFTLVGLQEYFYDQVHESMRSLGIAFYLSATGVASFLSSLLITIVDNATNRGGHQSWFVNNLNRCRLDYFYWLLAILSAINLCFYVCVARVYTYKEVKQRESGTTITALGLD